MPAKGFPAEQHFLRPLTYTFLVAVATKSDFASLSYSDGIVTQTAETPRRPGALRHDEAAFGRSFRLYLMMDA